MKPLDRNDRSFYIFSFLTLIIISVMTVAPVLLLLIASFTDEHFLLSNGYSFFPSKFSIEAYRSLLAQWRSILHAYGITVLVTAIGTTIHVIITVLFAYSISQPDFKYRKFFSFFIFFTMLFNGGIVPAYIMWTRYFGIKNTMFALLLPNYLLNAFNVILVKNYFQHTIPATLKEAAEIDGAGEFTVFSKIILPMSKPVVVTVALFSGTTYWNDWINGMYYVSEKKWFSLQQLLIQIQRNIEFLNSGQASGVLGTNYMLPTASYRMAIAVIGLLPILIVYPFLQKWLVKGVIIGAIKG